MASGGKGMDFAEDEKRLMRKHQLAVFEGLIIHDAQPPITPDQQAAIESLIGYDIPDDLLRLWRVSFGGSLDYECFVEYEAGLHPFSFTQLFFPTSQHYKTLIGWIEFELERFEEASVDRGEEWDGKLDILPIGGFEYLERVYVVAGPPQEAGQILIWSQGLPPAWVGRLTEDSQARVATDLAGFFHQLRHYEDPFAWTGDDDFRSGRELLGAIDALEAEGEVGSALAQKLHDLIRQTHFDWRARFEDNTLIGDAIGESIALEAILTSDDRSMLADLVEGGIDVSKRRRGGMNALDLAAHLSAKTCFEWLVEQGVPCDRTFHFGASRLDKRQVDQLLDNGASLQLDDIAYSVRSAEHLDAVEKLCSEFCSKNPGQRDQLIQALVAAGNGEIEFAKKMRSGVASSYRTADETEQQGKAILGIARRLSSRAGR